MLEYWYKDQRTLLDFRRGPLGPFFDGLAVRLKERGYAHDTAQDILSKCNLFNSYLIEQGLTECEKITPAHGEAFLDRYLSDFQATGDDRDRRRWMWGLLKHMFQYLEEKKIIHPSPPNPIPSRYRWLLVPYLQYLREEREFTEEIIRQTCNSLRQFLDSLGENVTPQHMKRLNADVVDAYLKQNLKETRENLRQMIGRLRGFLRVCASQQLIDRDLSGVLPAIPSYQLASLPKGMDDELLQRILNVIPTDSAGGARDNAILILMMAYGLRGKSITTLLLEDLNWPRSTIRIRTCKGGKEVVLPLLEAVGEAILRYLRFRPTTSHREVFLYTRAPYLPIKNMAVSALVRNKMIKAGVKTPKGGVRTLRHSWAIRALVHDSPIKAIADVLGHRDLNTTFIYAKADLKTLRQVVMPWPEER